MASAGDASAGDASAGDAGLAQRYIYFDGASRGNPGPSACGFVLYSGEVETDAGYRVLDGPQTCNVAEYRGLIAGLERAVTRGWHVDGRGGICVRGDSKLVINQVTGRWKVNAAHLKDLRDEARAVLRHFGSTSVVFEHVLRGRNARADQLANEGLDLRARE